MDKNILVVTGQDVEDMPFDIRGYEAKKYNSKTELYNIIEKEIKIFDIIKKQTFEPGEFIASKKFSPKQNGILTEKEAIKIANIPRLKNLRIKLDFRFLYVTNHEYDWFGIHLRAQKTSGFVSELALIRYSGKTRSVTWPEQRKENNGKNFQDYDPEKWCSMEILLVENTLNMWIHQQLLLEDQNLLVENFGELYLRANDHHHPIYFADKTEGKQSKNNNYLEIEYRNIEILDLSTTANLFE